MTVEIRIMNKFYIQLFLEKLVVHEVCHQRRNTKILMLKNIHLIKSSSFIPNHH